MKKITLTNEIASSYLSDSVLESHYETLLNNPKDYVKSQFNIDLNSEIAIVKNQPDLINLALPYYSALESMTSFAAIADEDLETITGGEILGVAIYLLGLLAVCGTVCIIGGAVSAATKKDK